MFFDSRHAKYIYDISVFKSRHMTHFSAYLVFIADTFSDRTGPEMSLYMKKGAASTTPSVCEISVSSCSFLRIVLILAEKA